MQACGPLENSTLTPIYAATTCTLQVDLDLELVTTSGYGKNGALTFLQRSVRPQIVTTFQLPDVRAAWTVKGPLNSDDVSIVSQFQIF